MFYYVPKQRAETERSRGYIMNRNQLLGKKAEMLEGGQKRKQKHK